MDDGGGDESVGDKGCQRLAGIKSGAQVDRGDRRVAKELTGCDRSAERKACTLESVHLEVASGATQFDPGITAL